MARKRKNNSTANLLVALPWQVSATIGCLAFASLRWVLPYSLKGNMFQPIFLPLANLSSWAAILFFGLVSIVAFFRAKAKSGATKTQSQNHFRDSPARRVEPREHSSPILAQASVQQDAGPIDPASTSPLPTAWSIEALRLLEWKRFEMLCAKYYEMVGFKTETVHCGADGGIDVKLFKVDPSKPLAIIQCKAWNSREVGVKEIRELLGVMTHEKVYRGVFITTSQYTKDAIAFGESNPIHMLGGEAFVGKIKEFSEEQQVALLNFAFEGDFATPTCPSCGIKMMIRSGRRGQFFGCSNYPRCRRTFSELNNGTNF